MDKMGGVVLFLQFRGIFILIFAMFAAPKARHFHQLLKYDVISKARCV